MKLDCSLGEYSLEGTRQPEDYDTENISNFTQLSSHNENGTDGQRQAVKSPEAEDPFSQKIAKCQKALQIPELLNEIFHQVEDHSSLKKLREVSKTWSALVTPIFHKSSVLNAQFGSFKTPSSSQEEEIIDSFISTFHPSRFKEFNAIPNIYFDNPQSFRNDKLQKWISEYGRFITKITIDKINPKRKDFRPHEDKVRITEAFYSKILPFLPNLKELILISSSSYFAPPSEELDQTLKLTSWIPLQHLTLVFREPNNERFECRANVHIYTHLFAITGKTLQSLTFITDINNGPRQTNIVPFIFSNFDSLSEGKPVFENLQKLEMKDNADSRSWKYPFKFPNLKLTSKFQELYLKSRQDKKYLNTYNESDAIEHFGSFMHHISPHLRRLSLEDFALNSEHFRGTFEFPAMPQLKYLKLIDVNEFHFKIKSWQILEYFPSLEELEVGCSCKTVFDSCTHATQMFNFRGAFEINENKTMPIHTKLNCLFIGGFMENHDVFENVARIFPNLKHFSFELSEETLAPWLIPVTKMKQLTSLVIHMFKAVEDFSQAVTLHLPSIKELKRLQFSANCDKNEDVDFGIQIEEAVLGLGQIKYLEHLELIMEIQDEKFQNIKTRLENESWERGYQLTVIKS